MKVPAIMGSIGDWQYYISVLPFDAVAEYVSRVDEQLHPSKNLSDMIQRSLKEGYEKIKEYLLSKDDRFFNSLVLAVYDGEPRWIEVEFEHDGEIFNTIGLLEFTGDEKIFPVDGQHRVEGIKAALESLGQKETNDRFVDDEVPVIFIGHNRVQMERTRRLFSTLNRYAKPVSLSDIIALDEDDSAAIVTRMIIENNTLFFGNRLSITETKSLTEGNKEAFTSIISLYDCNKRLLEYLLRKKNITQKINEFIKHRPDETFLNDYYDFCRDYWSAFTEKISCINVFIESKEKNSALQFRNKESGGNLLFRPLGLELFTAAIVEIISRRKKGAITHVEFSEIFSYFDTIDLQLSERPWSLIFWDNDFRRVRKSIDKNIIILALITMFDIQLLSQKDNNDFKKFISKRPDLGNIKIETLISN